MSCSCKKPADVFNNVCGVCLLPIKEMSLQSKYDDLKAKYEKCVSALKTYHLESCDRFDNERICAACKVMAELGEE